MSILMFVIFGFVVGLLARAIMPGKQGMGIFATAGLGMIGSFLGGTVGAMLAGHTILEFHTSGLVGSLLGAIAVLAIFGLSGRTRTTA